MLLCHCPAGMAVCSYVSVCVCGGGAPTQCWGVADGRGDERPGHFIPGSITCFQVVQGHGSCCVSWHTVDRPGRHLRIIPTSCMEGEEPFKKLFVVCFGHIL